MKNIFITTVLLIISSCTNDVPIQEDTKNEALERYWKYEQAQILYANRRYSHYLELLNEIINEQSSNSKNYQHLKQRIIKIKDELEFIQKYGDPNNELGVIHYHEWGWPRKLNQTKTEPTAGEE